MSGPLRDAAGNANHLVGDPIYDPLNTESFNLYFTETSFGDKVVASTIKPPVISPASTQSQILISPPTEERRRAQRMSHMPPFAGEGWKHYAMTFRGGLCYRAYRTGQGFEYCVSSYEGLLRGDWKGILRIPVTEKEVGSYLWDTWDLHSEISVDEASGRVLIWVGNDHATRCYVGALV